jgi:predicted SnoaL-like aldol condensation-catalyzing enzyme
MGKVTSLLAVAALALGCEAVDRGGKLGDNRALVLRAHVEVWSGGDMAAADEIYAAEFVGHWTGRPDTRGREVVAEGDLVVTRFTSRGTFDGEPSHGKEITMPEIAIHRIVHGKIVEQWTVADILGMRQQLGTLDAPVDESASER